MQESCFDVMVTHSSPSALMRRVVKKAGEMHHIVMVHASISMNACQMSEMSDVESADE